MAANLPLCGAMKESCCHSHHVIFHSPSSFLFSLSVLISVAFGIRKALIAEQKRAELTRKIKAVRAETAALQQQVSDADSSIQSFIRRAEEKRASEERAFEEEVERVKRVNEALRVNLEAVLSAPKK